MNRNLQAFGVIRTSHEVLFSDQMIPVQEFRTDLKQVLTNPRVDTLIEHLESGANVTQFDEDTWWTIVDDLKAHLGSQCANMAGDSRDEQESALVAAETWVEDNISHSSRARIVAVAVVLYGYAKAETMIRELSSAVAA
ncbi:hypothetical protein A8H39_00225 [Paraburkholderia fungorum]|uniref:hypothetical protein n=1 Tax=Paraburkholderia fungorum TaxID=134537 RepID=UPI000487E43E|nr:hypothetical protein [Paraburkholderia fungorum]PNE59609.1 hypothetical protein A8H39_00225 [Paraburkholderia fungorum]